MTSPDDRTEGPPEPAAVREALDRIEASGALGGSRLGPLLRHLVEEELAGRGDTLKAYAIGVDALGRSEAFDPSTDSIVRVEVARLRVALGAYYGGAGADDPVRIDIPKGGYRPVVTRTGRAAAAQAPPIPAGEAPARTRGGGRVLAALVLLLGLGLSALLLLLPEAPAARPDHIRIVLRADPHDPPDAPAYAVAQDILLRFPYYEIRQDDPPGPPVPEDYEILLRQTGDQIQMLARHRLSGALVASHVAGLRHDEAGLLSEGILSRYALAVARFLQRSGEIEAHYLALPDHAPTLHCLVLTERYFSRQTDARHAEARDCLERLRGTGLETAASAANLSFLYREEFTDRRNMRGGDALDRALAEARRSGALDPSSPLGPYAAMTVLMLMGATDEAVRAGEAAVRLNPYDGDMAAGFAARLVTAGRYGRAEALFARASLLLASVPRWVAYGQFVARFAQGDADRAARIGLGLAGTTNTLHMAALAISLDEAGRRDEARAVAAGLRRVEFDLRAMFERRAYQPALVEELLARIAGIEAGAG